MQAGRERTTVSEPAPLAALWAPPGLPWRIATRLRRRHRAAAAQAAAPDAIDRAIARVKAGLPGCFATADRVAVEAGAAHLLSLPRPVALRRIAERIYDPHGFALRPPEPRPASVMLDDLRIRLAAAPPGGEHVSDPVWHERRSRRLAWLECRRALIAILHDQGGEAAAASREGEAPDDAERRRQAALATEAEQL